MQVHYKKNPCKRQNWLFFLLFWKIQNFLFTHQWRSVAVFLQLNCLNNSTCKGPASKTHRQLNLRLYMTFCFDCLKVAACFLCRHSCLQTASERVRVDYGDRRTHSSILAQAATTTNITWNCQQCFAYLIKPEHSLRNTTKKTKRNTYGEHAQKPLGFGKSQQRSLYAVTRALKKLRVHRRRRCRS